MRAFPASFPIGPKNIVPATVLAPMAGVTDTVFRRLIRDQGGCGLIMTEFTSSHGVVASVRSKKESKTEKRYLCFEPEEHPISSQLFGSDPKVMADAGPCGLWPYDLGPTYDREHYENRQYYNLGCANQRNLAAMVDNPSDLVQPRSEIPSYTGRRTTVLDKHHRGEPSGTVYPDAGKGKISDVGQ